MELRHLRYFATLAETLHFTKAAERCHVTQSTLSHQIKQLEDELDVKLFDRVGKKIFLTEVGDRLLTEVIQALKQIDLAVNAIQTPPVHISGHIRIGTTYSVNTNLLPRCISDFLARHKDIRVSVEELSQSEILKALENDQLDLGIAYKPDGESTLWFDPLYTEEMVLIVAKEHLLAKRKKVRMIELNNVRMVLLSKVFGTRQKLDYYFKTIAAEPLVIAEMNAIAPIVELVRNTDLAGIVAKTAIHDNSDVCAIPLENPRPTRTTGLLWKKGKTDETVVKEFTNVIRNVLNGTSSNLI